MRHSWKPLTEAPLLEDGQIHVWKIDLDLLPDQIENLKLMLSPTELGKADRFHRQDDRRRYVAAHGRLRKLLALYVNAPADALEFSDSTKGKPQLSGTHSVSGFRFNLSHSHGLALLAVARSREVGVDIERVREVSEIESIAGNYFSQEERKCLSGVPEPERTTTFFRYWTRKEALLKSIGEGLSDGLDKWCVAFAPSESGDVTAGECRTYGSIVYEITDLDPAEGYVGACAAEGKSTRIDLYEYI